MSRRMRIVRQVVLLLLVGAMGCGTLSENARPDPLSRVAGESQAATPGEESARIRAEVAFKDGESRLRSGEVQAGLARLDDALQAGLSTARLHYLRAVALSRMGRVDEAADEALRAFARSPELPFMDALSLHVRLAIRGGSPESALDMLDARVKEDPDNLGYQNLQHWVWLVVGRHADVLRESRRILKRDETNLGAMLNLARTFLVLEQQEQAVYVLRRILAIAPDNSEARVLYADALLRSDDAQGAIVYLKEALEKEPSLVEVRNSLGVVYQGFGDSASARAELEQVVLEAPGMTEAWLNLGNAHRGLGDPASAIQAYEQALKNSPEDADAHFNLGIVFLESELDGYGREDQLRRAVEEFDLYQEKKGLSLAKDDPVLVYIAEAQQLIKRAIKRREELASQPEEDEDDADEDEDEDEDDEDYDDDDDDEDYDDDDEDDEDDEDDADDEESASPAAGESVNPTAPPTKPSASRKNPATETQDEEDSPAPTVAPTSPKPAPSPESDEEEWEDASDEEEWEDASDDEDWEDAADDGRTSRRWETGHGSWIDNLKNSMQA